MKVVIQRVFEASVEIDNKIKGQINQGLLLFVGIEEADTNDDLEWLCKKIVNMRIFGDVNGNMNLSLIDVKGEALIISQFTLHASTKKGNRPSFIKAAKPDFAEQKYEEFKQTLGNYLSGKIQSGKFGADMKVSLVNDGPVTIVLDSKNKE